MKETKSRLYKCWYKNCKIGKVANNEAIKIGNKRYHKKCYQDLEDLKKCRELYVEYINPAVVHVQLNSTINNLVNDKKIKPCYLLYVIEYIIDNKLEVKSVYSLHYFINNYKIKNSYKSLNDVKKAVESLKIYS